MTGKYVIDLERLVVRLKDGRVVTLSDYTRFNFTQLWRLCRDIPTFRLHTSDGGVVEAGEIDEKSFDELNGRI